MNGLLKSKGLEKYYSLKALGNPLRRPIPPASHSEEVGQFAYLDDPEFLKLYSWQDQVGENQDRWMEFYLEGVHCAACVWLTEKVSDLVPGVHHVRLDLGRSVVSVKIAAEGAFSRVASEFQAIGYSPHPVAREDASSHQKKENQRLIARIAVAGTCAGNIMLLSISVYAGASGALAYQFRWISLALYLPVILFCAVPFYRSAWKALRSRTPTIDIPVVFGVLLGSVASIVNLGMGSDQVYFDSLSTLVFLLLTTRFVLKRAQQNSFSATHLLNFLTPSRALRQNLKTGDFEEVRLDQVQLKDHLKVKAGDYIPVDGLVISGKSSVNSALLTGESLPVPVVPGSPLFAGTVNLDGVIVMEVHGSGAGTRLGRILRSVEESLFSKARMITFSDRVSRVFVSVVLVLSLGILVWGLAGHFADGLNRALALAIVTCPCAFALATPLAFSQVIGRFAKMGILIKGSEVLERLSQVREVFLDKTGTLTMGTPEVLHWTSSEDIVGQRQTEAAVLSLEIQSRHPVAKALIRYLIPRTTPAGPPEKFQEILGRGVSGHFGPDFYEVHSAPDRTTSSTVIEVLKNGERVARVLLGDHLREGSASAVRAIRELGLRTWILSGDHWGSVQSVGEAVGIPRLSQAAEASPENKSDMIQAHPFSAMVGDGANDSVALAQAHVGIAVHSGAEVSLRVADIYLSKAGVEPVARLVVAARETMKVIRRNFGISIAYNVVAGVAALMGKIDPVFAAILMPMSSISVIVSSLVGTRLLRAQFKEDPK